MRYKLILLLILIVDTIILYLQTAQLSISYHEASVLYGSSSFLQKLIQMSISFLGQNDFALRFPMIIFHLMSVVLLYQISFKYLKNDRNRIWLILVFILIPGVISSAILVDDAGIVIFSLLLFTYVYQNYQKYFSYLLLTLYLFVSGSFIYLYLALVFYAYYKKERYFFILNLLYFFISIYIFGIDTQGLPKGHFLDLLGLYSAVFTPIIFIYIFYVLYRKFLTKEMDILWFISSIPLVFSLLLSFRQNINIEVFAPYLLLSLPIVAQVFASTYRVRLKMFRKKYKLIFIVSFLFLIINTLFVIFNKDIYLLLDDPKRNFSYKMHIAKELAYKLKSIGIDCVETENSMAKRLRFYGVTKCDKFELTEGLNLDPKNKNVTIRYKNKLLYSGYVTNINK